MAADTYKVDGKSYTAAQILDDADLRDRWTAAEHTRRYPKGCRSTGHMCEACSVRLADVPHRYVKIGARKFYKGRWVCTVSGCPYYGMEG